ncbi:MAG: sodium:solute symporter [Chloroflexota bacterium]
MVDWTALVVFTILFACVTVIGFLASRWRAGDLDILHEWGLAGGRFGTIVSWFLLGGDLYTAYTFVAVPALMYGKGALGFFAMPYTIVVYPIVFLFMPRLWSVCRAHGYITAADFVRGRFDSSGLALAIALTGILATMPYIALQMYGIAVVIYEMGVNVEVALIVAFLILAAFTYVSGLRAPALIAIVKDTMIWITVIVAVIYIPSQLGGLGHVFSVVSHIHPKPAPAPPPPPVILPAKQFWAYSTLALGSALALFLYPHSITGVLSTQSRAVIRRNMAALPIYSFMLGLIALLGFMALAAGIKPSTAYKANSAVPALIHHMFPSWFAGFAFAAIAIGALVPASIMSIAAANLFTRNIWRTYVRPDLTARQESTMAKIISLVVKLGALLFILFGLSQQAIDLQLLGGVWMLQTLPAVVIGLYTRWFHTWALLCGWATGMVAGTWWAKLAGDQAIPHANYGSVYTFMIGGHAYGVYPALSGLVLNLVVTVVLTPVFNALVARGGDETEAADYVARAPASA